MSKGRMHGRFRQRMEERIAEIRHRLVIEEACGGATNAPGFLEMEEELLDEAADLERLLLRKRSLLEGPHRSSPGSRSSQSKKSGCEDPE